MYWIYYIKLFKKLTSSSPNKLYGSVNSSSTMEVGDMNPPSDSDDEKLASAKRRSSQKQSKVSSNDLDEVIIMPSSGTVHTVLQLRSGEFEFEFELKQDDSSLEDAPCE